MDSSIKEDRILENLLRANGTCWDTLWTFVWICVWCMRMANILQQNIWEKRRTERLFMRTCGCDGIQMSNAALCPTTNFCRGSSTCIIIYLWNSSNKMFNGVFLPLTEMFLTIQHQTVRLTVSSNKKREYRKKTESRWKHNFLT